MNTDQEIESRFDKEMEEQVEEETRKVQQEMQDLWIRLKNEEVSSNNQLLGPASNNYIDQRIVLLEAALEKAKDSIFPRLECLLQKLEGSSPSSSACVPNCRCFIPKKQIKLRKTLLAESFKTLSTPSHNSSALLKDRSPCTLDEELYLAAEKGRIDDILRILKAGADINSTTSGETTLQAAAWNGDDGVVSTLLARGADVNRMATTMAPLHYASFRGHSTIVSLMIQCGADVNVRDEAGMTPLHNAAMQGHMECILLLLDAGADPSIKNDFGDTPQRVSTDSDISDLLDIDKTVVLF